MLVLLIGIYDTLDIMGTDEPGAEVKLGIGMWLTDLGGIVATAAVGMLKLNASKSPMMAM